ncbi:MAG: futalosine hydrolase [Chitinophagaceae bacterium]|nr:MAG: futalosine hydrolase [Chitinophagaceae bacterium]
MPDLLLCSATAFEIQPTLGRLDAYGGRVEVLITGVGLLETAFALAARLSEGAPPLLLQAGIAGCLDEARPLSSVVAIGSDGIGDLGVREGGRFQSTFDLGFGDPDAAPWQGGRLPNNTELPALSGLPVVSAVSVSTISTDADTIGHYRSAWGAVAESMEGAAFHFAARKWSRPFLQVRAFSNYIGERDKSRWQLRKSIAALNRQLETLIPQLLSL